MTHRSFAFAILIAVAPGTLGAQQRRVMTFEDFASVRAVADPQVSPDGTQILYTVRTTDVAANKRTPRTYIVPVPGGTPRAFPDASTAASEARWSPDGSRVAYTTAGQLWIADASGANARQLTTLSGGASGPVWAPTGDRIAFVSSVYPECDDDACNAMRQKAASENPVKAHIADELLFRHWNAYDEGTRSHLFVVRPDGSDLRDLVPRARYDVPPAPFGGSEGYTISPDGREAAFSAKDAGRESAWSTDVNVYVVPIDGSRPPVAITAANRGADQNPVYSPDGRLLLYASQQRATFESDRWRLMAYDRAARRSREVAPRFDRWANGYIVLPDSRSVLVSTDERGRNVLYRLSLDSAARSTGAPQLILSGRNNTSPSLARDGRTLAWLRDAADRPPEVWAAHVSGAALADAHVVTHENDALVSQLALNPAEDYWYRGAGGDSVHGLVIKPPQLAQGRKYPLLLLIHGGPQGAWLDSWGSRWAPQMFASGGYGVVMINPHGSTGYGQAFIDAVSRDWGGKTYVDLMRGVDAALAKNQWLDSTRMAAAGGSYGGYMANWLEGHTNRFKALISHAGVFNLEAMAGATEEIWFTEWDFGGPWWNPDVMATQYRKFSPHLYAARFRTPMLVLHGELDYRVPYTEGLSLFTALQRRGVPSRLVLFPDEGHWILKPQNSRLWWSEVHRWLAKYLTGAPIT